MQHGARPSAACEYESPKGRDAAFERVDPALKPRDIGFPEQRFFDSHGNTVPGVGQHGANGEEVTLQVFEHPANLGIDPFGPGVSQPGVHLVDLTVGLHEGVALADSRAVEQAGFALVAGLCVNLHWRQPIIVATVKKPSPLPPPARRQWFRRRLLEWYRRNGRDLPWRNTRDPYHILVSEVMLQQTQVDRVLPKYHEWLGQYPSLEALAEAPEADVVGTWYPLGYNIRPRRLQAIARESMAKYGGELPRDEETLLSFKGIGAYTAGAVMSFAFGKRAAILDTNVARVLFRIFVGKGEPRSHAMVKRLWELSRVMLPHKHVFDFNQALMDFGATVCTARAPLCPACVMKRGCKSYPFAAPVKVKAQIGVKRGTRR
jgi:A/G-specific adenine glycosylase